VQSHFRIEVRSQDHTTTVLAITGELDLASSPVLQKELDRISDSDSGRVILDLRDLSFMDSTGLSVLVKAHQRAEDSGRRFVLVKGGQQVQRLLNLTGLAEHLEVVDAPEELLDTDQTGPSR
jgi:anti-anti-sigma factor